MSKQYLQTHTLPSAHPTDIFSLAATPTHLLSASGSSSILIHRTKSQTIHADTAEDENPYPLVQTLEKVHPLGTHHVCASVDGKVSASAGFGGEVKVWQLDSQDHWQERGQIIPQDKKESSWAIALNEDGQYLAVTTHDGRINVYDTSSLSPGTSEPTSRIAQYETKGSFALSVDISPNGALTASGHRNGTLHIFTNATQRLSHSLAGLIKPIRAVKFSPASTLLAAAGDARIIALYSTATGQQVANLTGHGSWIMSLSWNWSGELLLSGSWDGKAKVWSVERRECVATQTENDERCVWAVAWLWKAAAERSEKFVTAGAGGGMSFYREAAGV